MILDGLCNKTVLISTIHEDDIPDGFPLIEREPSTAIVKQGKQAAMQCSANGDPKPRISWSKDNIPVNMTDPRITVAEKGVRISSIMEYKSLTVMITLSL